MGTDPKAILKSLPERERAEFLRQYEDAVEGARDPAGYQRLQHVLRLWQLTAAAVDQPGYYESLDAAQHGQVHGIPLEEVIAKRRGLSLATARNWWSDQVTARLRRVH